jgi:hypothetical protein
MRLYADYLVDEVRDIVSDYVFVNLWREPIGEAMSVSAVEDLFRRLSKRTQINLSRLSGGCRPLINKPLSIFCARCDIHRLAP